MVCKHQPHDDDKQTRTNRKYPQERANNFRGHLGKYSAICYSTAMQNVEKHRFRIARSKPGKGFGLYARDAIVKGEYLMDYIGKRIDSKLADSLPTKYLFEIDEQWTIDGSVRSNLARYINHACEPNCEADIRDGRIMIFACKDIATGQELTIDYGEEYFNEFIKPYGCKCETCAKKLRIETAQ